MASAAATARKNAPTTRCCRKWARRRPRCGITRPRTARGRSNSRRSPRTFAPAARRVPACAKASARSKSSRRSTAPAATPSATPRSENFPMIITRSPLRISLGGGGTDLPSYYREHGGFLVAGALDKYVYLTLHRTFVPELIVKYSKLERVSEAAKLEHPLIREAFALLKMDGRS